MDVKSCPECGGTGFVVEEREGAQVAKPCPCHIPDRATRLVERASIPLRYRKRYTFGMYKPDPAFPSQEEALTLARRYAEDYPALPEGANGLLFIGPCGVGKTHLAVSILQEVVVRKGMPALFVDLNDLYREIRASYGHAGNEETEYDILSPLVEALPPAHRRDGLRGHPVGSGYPPLPHQPAIQRAAADPLHDELPGRARWRERPGWRTGSGPGPARGSWRCAGPST